MIPSQAALTMESLWRPFLASAGMSPPSLGQSRQQEYARWVEDAAAAVYDACSSSARLYIDHLVANALQASRPLYWQISFLSPLANTITLPSF